MSPVWILLTLLPILGAAERFNCKGRILGAYYADAKSGCKAFHVCVRVAGGGIRDFRFFCPPGTLFHQEAQTCTDWGDDDPLACPADIYDGQFDLYRIGSGFDTKKISSYGNRDDEAEFGLQRAETGDRRLSQNNNNNNASPNKPDSDLRAAHSSDFFSGQRDRGRDDSASTAQSASPAPSSVPSQSRQSFRRPTTQRTFPTTQQTFPTTQYSSPVPSSSPQPSSRSQYDTNSKRKLVRKRPIYVSSKAPSTLPPNTPANYPEPPHQSSQSYNPKKNYEAQQNFNSQTNFSPQQTYNTQQPFSRNVPLQNRQSTTPNVPPQYREYKDEYVEVSRVTPKQTRFFQNSSPSTPFQLSTHAQKYNNKKDGLVELYNYDAQSTPGLNAQTENRPFKVRNNFNVADVSKDPEFSRTKNFDYNNVRDASTTADYSASTRGFSTTTPAYKNFNSVSYEPEKNNFVSYSKQNNFNSYPTTTASQTTTTYTTPRPQPPQNLNTVAYNTNIGFFAQPNDFAGNDEDDGQYHPPAGEDDGQYKPELYDRELLAGAHSLNIAASGNRLPEDRKTYSKTPPPSKSVSQTAAPRPFRPAPSPTAPPTTRVTTTTPPVSTTTVQPQTAVTRRPFDFFQTYTTTSKPVDYFGLAQTFTLSNEASVRPTTSDAPRYLETRPPRPVSREPSPSSQPSSAPPRPTTRPSHLANPVNNKEDNSYDYAYYDSDTGFSEYDHIEEFGKTNKKIS